MNLDIFFLQNGLVAGLKNSIYFFDPWFSLVKKKIGETVYGIGWMPFGGYVKISGMVDESMDKEAIETASATMGIPEQTGLATADHYAGWCYRECVLAFFIYAMIVWHWGDEYIPPMV